MIWILALKSLKIYEVSCSEPESSHVKPCSGPAHLITGPNFQAQIKPMVLNLGQGPTFLEIIYTLVSNMLGWSPSSRIIGPGLAHWTIGPEIRPGTPHGLKIKPKSSSIRVGFGLTLLKYEAMGAGYFLPWVRCWCWDLVGVGSMWIGP